MIVRFSEGKQGGSVLESAQDGVALLEQTRPLTHTAHTFREVPQVLAVPKSSRNRRPEDRFPNIPWYRVAGVYGLYRDGQIVYVGHSQDIRTRVLHHARRFHFDRIEYSVIESKSERKRMERRLLVDLRPIENSVVPTVYETAWYR